RNNTNKKIHAHHPNYHEQSRSYARYIAPSRSSERLMMLISATGCLWIIVTRTWTRSSLLCAGLLQGLLISVAQPQQAVDYQPILDCVVERIRQSLVGSVILVLIVNVVVAHVEIEHLVFLVGPDHGIVSAVPYLILFRPGAQRKTGWVYGEQDVYFRILSQIFLPTVPLAWR